MAGAFVLVAGTLDRVAIPGDPPQFLLAGVILVEGKVEKALLVEPTLTRGRPFMVAKGGRIGPYRLVKVLEDQVVLVRGDQELTVRLGAPTRGASRREPAVDVPSPGPAPPAPRSDADVRAIDQNPSRSESIRAERRQRKQAERRSSRSERGAPGAKSDPEPDPAMSPAVSVE
jgi:hypothetical protein